MILIYHIFVVTLLFFGLIHISPPSYFRASIASRTRLSLKQQVSATSWKSTSGFYIFYLSRHSWVTKSCFALRISFFFSTVPTNTSKVVLNIFKSQGGIRISHLNIFPINSRVLYFGIFWKYRSGRIQNFGQILQIYIH